MHAFSFGQVVFPTSRAIDECADDFEEDVENPYEICLSKLSINVDIDKVDTLLLAIGTHPFNFTRVYVLPSDAKADVRIDVKLTVEPAEEIPSTTCCSLQGYYLKDHCALVFTAVSQLDPQICHELNKKIFELIPLTKELQVFVLDVKSDINYYPAVFNDEGPLVRAIETAPKIITNEKIKALKIPNTLDGLSAAVITHCEIQKVYAAVVVVITRAINFDMDSTNAFRVLTELPRLKPLIKETSNTTNNALKALNRNNSSMYV